MATRKDLLKAQSFISRRMVAAFVHRDPNDPTPPLRRIGTASFVSVLLGVILLAGTALIGMIRPGGGGNAWQDEEVIISDTSAGMLFVYREGLLYPMSDVTSARLVAGGKDAQGTPRVVKVSTEKLKGTPQQVMQGIPGAPRQLPAADDMESAPLRLCSSAPDGAGNRFVSLEFSSSSGSDTIVADPVSGDERMSFVAQTPDDEQYLVSGGKVHKLWRAQNEPSPLVGDLPVVKPGNLWLSALPVGAPVDRVVIPNKGMELPGNQLGMRVGDLAEVAGVEGGFSRYYIQLEGGLTRLSYLDVSLIRALESRGAPRKISETELAQSQNPDQERFGNTDVILDKPQGPSEFPSLKDQSVCATYTGEENGRVVLSVGKDTPEMDASHLAPYGNQLDLIDIDPLNGGLLQSAAIKAKEPVTILVLDGVRYSIPNKASLNALGYGDVAPIKVPAQLYNVIPEGLEAGSNLSLEHVVTIS